jgi:hypothetical protein
MVQTTESLSASAALAAPAGVGVESYVRCPPGEIVTGLRPGDLLLIRGPGWLGRLIRFFAWARFRKDYRRYGHWSHAALVVTPAGHVLEVHARGVGLCTIEKYRNTDFCYVRLDLDEARRVEAARYAYACLGQRYDVAGFMLLGISVLSGGRLRVRDNGRPGCVSLIARALGRAGIAFDCAPPELMPADLAKHFGVLP